MPNYGRDLATGMAIGEKLMGNINQGIATRKRTALREEVDKGLVKGEDGSYDYLGKKFQYEPSRYERSALEAEKRATLEEDWGDQERADAYRAITQGYIEKDLDHRTRQILASGNPAQAVDLWNQHNPDRMARWENNQLLFSPRGREDWLPVYSGDPQGAMEFIGSQYSPDVVKEMADTRLKNMERELRMSLGKQNLAQGDLSMENMRQGMGERGMDRQDADFQRQYKMAADQLELAIKSRDPQAIAQAQEHYNRVAGSNSAGLGGGRGAGGDESVLNSLIKTESGGRWDAVGPPTRSGERALGRLQFMPSRLADAEKALGIKIDPQEFLKNPELQQRVEQWHLADLDRQISQAGLYKLAGQNVGGYDITPNGLIASAHLGGFTGLQKFLATKGGHNPDDGRTRIGDYMSYHAGGSTGGASSGPTGLGGDSYYKGLSQAGLVPGRTGKPPVTNFDFNKALDSAQEWAVSNAPEDATPEVVEALTMERLQKLQSLYAQTAQGLGGAKPGASGAPAPDEMAAATKALTGGAAKPEPAKAKTAEEAAAAAKAGIGPRAEEATKAKETAATKQAQQAALGRVRQVEGGVKLLGNIRDPALARSKATSHRAAILKDYEALSVEGQKQADAMLAKISDLFPDLE